MDRVEFREKMSGFRCKVGGRRLAKSLLLLEPKKQPAHLASDVFRIAKRTGALGDTYPPKSTSPAVDVLEEVMMHGPVVADREAARRQRFEGPRELMAVSYSSSAA
jgi:hypothetical protein